ncbi:MAG: DUF359 domain-containing protein, partial [Candidatus Thermoplasmatota archaeon]|nr:DUF359 domain-containing protein [Candidatus Thermoplasmatota archaeon]
MQLKSGKIAVIGSDLRKEIVSTRHNLCSVGEIAELSSGNIIVAVGDATAESLHHAGITPFLEVVDLTTKRGERQFPHIEGSISVDNPAGCLTSDLFLVIGECLSGGEPRRVEVTGEEDLAVIPIIYYAPLIRYETEFLMWEEAARRLATLMFPSVSFCLT